MNDRPFEQMGPNAELEGYMQKEGGNYKSWKKRYFILKAGRLEYYADKDGVRFLLGGDIMLPSSIILSSSSGPAKEGRNQHVGGDECPGSPPLMPLCWNFFF